MYAQSMSNQAKKIRRTSPSVPDWLLDLVIEEKEAIGKVKGYGGARSTYICALALYLSFPEADRRWLAQKLSDESLDSAMSDLNLSWIGRGVKALAAGGPDAAEHLSQWVAADQKKPRNPDTSTAASLEPDRRSRKSARDRGAA